LATGGAEALAVLLADPGAEIDRETLAAALAAFPGDDRLHAAMIGRAALPPEIVQRLGALVADHRIPALVRRHAAPEGADRVPQAERATASAS
jgi:hypothetical protein